MKKFLITVAIVWTTLWFGLNGIMNAAKADDYNNAVVGHVITQVIQGVDVDHSELLEAELEKIAYKVAVEMTAALEKHLPYILEALASEIRQNADVAYKCKLLENSTYECK